MFSQHSQLANTKVPAREKFVFGMTRYDYVKNPLFFETVKESDNNKSISSKHYGRISHSMTIQLIAIHIVRDITYRVSIIISAKPIISILDYGLFVWL